MASGVSRPGPVCFGPQPTPTFKCPLAAASGHGESNAYSATREPGTPPASGRLSGGMMKGERGRNGFDGIE